MTHMRLVTANIKSNPVMRQSYVDSDIRRVRALSGITLWQEIAPQRYKSAIIRLMPGRTHVALSTENPISYRPQYWRAATVSELPDMSDAPSDLFPQDFWPSGYLKMHGGRRLVTPTRYLSYAILVGTKPKTPPVVWMNTHMLSSAWSNRKPLTKKWRRAQWWIHFNKQRQIVHYFRSKGLTVVGGGDTNRVDMPKFHPSQRWLAQGGIDHLYCVEAPGGARIILTESHVVRGLHTDHSPRVAELVVHKEKRA